MSRLKSLFQLCQWVLLFFSHAPSSLWSDSIAISGNPSTLTISSASAGQQPNSVTDNSTTYSVTTLLVSRSVTGNLDSNMPSQVTLQVSLAAPSGATSLGPVTMTNVAKNLVTGIPILTLGSANTMTYTLSATVSAAQVSNASKTLTLTIQ